ncbi:MAG TPA: HAD family hydrolase [Candidatus Binataceae bacterium]|nr:HAD family hydrolase [Candidatus Binataceae bacterium]
MGGSAREALNLIFDADDTLWDSNIHFLEAFDEFVAACGRSGLEIGLDGIKTAVRDAELDLIRTLGYGRRPYVLALHRAADALVHNGEGNFLHAEIDRIGGHLIERHCELLPDVGPTLQELAGRHTLLLLTKGQRDEQLGKLQRSGLADLFSRVETPHEKDIDAYRRLIVDADLHPELTWMIGNSPRSDINPAVRAGIRAVFIPHSHTWDLEHEELVESERIVELDGFRRLLELF